MFKRIVVPLDGSPRAELALGVAARLVRAAGGTVILVEVVQAPVEFEVGVVGPATWAPAADSLERKVAASYLEQVAASAVLADVRAETGVYAGPVAATLLLVAQRQHADLIVMTTHGRAGLAKWALGSVAEKLVHEARVPVLVLRDPHPQLVPPSLPHHPLRVLVPLDGSELSEAALIPAVQAVGALALPGPAAVHLVRVFDVVDSASMSDEAGSGVLDMAAWRERAIDQCTAYVSAVAARLREGIGTQLPLAVTWSVVPNPQFGSYEADVASAIVRAAEMGEATEGTTAPAACDLLAMATHGRSGLSHWMLGSITERVLHTTTLPILIVRPQGTARHGNET